VLSGTLLAIAFCAHNLLLEPYASAQHGPTIIWLKWIEGVRPIAAFIVAMSANAAGTGLFYLFLLFLVQRILRLQWLAATFIVLFGAAFYSLRSTETAATAAFLAVASGWFAFVLIRFGVLTFAVGYYVCAILASCPLTTDFSAWYAQATIAGAGATLLLGAYCFHTALAGRRILREGFLEG
jgi:hypothetical protein